MAVLKHRSSITKRDEIGIGRWPKGKRILEICAYNAKMKVRTENAALIRSRLSHDLDDGLVL
jgi:hypothetical protein